MKNVNMLAQTGHVQAARDLVAAGPPGVVVVEVNHTTPDWRTRTWTPSSKCCYPACSMTLCTPVGAGQMLCWLHALQLGLDLWRAER